jgi:hypothetical protein
MKNNWYKPLIILLISGSLIKCIDPYSPKLDKFQSLLVVDARLTDENRSNYVSLSRSIKTVDEDPVMVSGAVITISDDLGNTTNLKEKSEGIYKTDSLIFRGQTGRTYTLNIKTSTGEEYESEPCLMYPEQGVDSIYFGKDREIVNGEAQDGLRIYIDSEGESDCKYYRWTFEEWWKLVVPDPQRYDYINDTTIIERTQINHICWGNKKSNEIIIESTVPGVTNMFRKKPVLFVASEKSTRLLIQYCIQVNQLSISREEYEFWNHMSEINESVGNIFDKQPYQVKSNLHNINNGIEQVLGYFQVSSVKKVRKYITNSEISNLDLPLFNYSCQRVEKGEDDYPPPITPVDKMTFDKIYSQYTNSGYLFTEPLYDGGHKLSKLVFTTAFCADCTLQGSTAKPDFWVDME